MVALKRFSPEAAARLREEIGEAGGNEVFALGFLDENRKITRIEVSARGNEDSVLALRGRFEDADVLIHNHPSGFLTPSDNDLVISSRAAQGGLGSFIVDNKVEEVYVVAEAARKRNRTKLDPRAITAALEEGGAIALRLPAYETRRSQLGLMELVIRGFNEDLLVAAEAGTGVGKSFAYLLPALSFGEANEERIVISTATITLQQQLFEKDIPLVAEALKTKVKTVLVKGRGNYLCRRRLEDALREGSLDEEENENLRTITLWAGTSRTGSRSDLSFMPPESLWSRLCSEADNCMGMRCPERERCFVLALRREAADARILVVNHHLLFADLAARREGAGYDGTVVLPPFNRVILDEAHTVEDAATSFFSREFSRISVYRQLGRLYRKRGIARSGLLLRVLALLPSDYRASLSKSGDDEMTGGIPSPFEELLTKIRDLTDELDQAALELCGGSGVFRLVPQKDRFLRASLLGHFVSLKKHIASLGMLAGDMLEHLPEAMEEEAPVWELKSVLRRLDAIGLVCTSFTEYAERPEEVMWIERRSGRGASGADWAAFTATPVDVAPGLRESLFEPCKTVVCVSATLTANRSFDYWSSRSGLALMKDREILSGVFPSPFPYESSVLLAVPRDAALPTEGGFGVFVDEAAAALAESSGGSALVLFTSYQALRSAWEEAKPRLEEQGIRVLKQGDDDRNRLLRTFLADEKSVLFATDSFWEGVDAPGDTLRLVILCRLPFKSPSDPVFEARCEAVEKAGGSAFMELSLPEAVMKFKQGFGRLMRRSTDRGVVAVLDGRLLRKRYGEIFLASLPETKTCFGDFKTIIRATEDFLFP
jgi:ATP-dependent DNA helicase DinG